MLWRMRWGRWFDASDEEKQALWRAVDAVKADLDLELSPAGYNLGINAGEAAGQTVMHLHLHVIPRFEGDMSDPRGGIRGVIPHKQKYGDSPSHGGPSDDPFASLPAFVPGQSDQLLQPLRHGLTHAEDIAIVAAFAQDSGVRLLESDLVDAAHRGARVRLLTSDYQRITHPDALQRLLTLHHAHENLEARLFPADARGIVFHPKAYLFVRDPHGIAYVGSSNLSRSALTDGIEWNLRATRGNEPTSPPSVPASTPCSSRPSHSPATWSTTTRPACLSPRCSDPSPAVHAPSPTTSRPRSWPCCGNPEPTATAPVWW